MIRGMKVQFSLRSLFLIAAAVAFEAAVVSWSIHHKIQPPPQVIDVYVFTADPRPPTASEIGIRIGLWSLLLLIAWVGFALFIKRSRRQQL